jgi:GAF domain-containing protein
VPHTVMAEVDATSLAVVAEIARIALEDLAPLPMQQRITDALAKHFGWEFVALIAIDHEHGQFRCEALTTNLPTDIHVGYGRALGSGVVGRVAATGEVVLVSDARSVPDFVHTLVDGVAELAVPIRHRGVVIGVLNLESRSAHAFDAHVDFAVTIAALIAGAIAAARQFAELERRSAMLSLVADVTRTLTESEDLDALLDHLLVYLRDRYATLEATVLFESDVRDHLEVMAHLGASGHITRRGKLWPTSAGIVGRCYCTRELQFVADVRVDPAYVSVNAAAIAELAVPIRFRGQVFGVINLETDDAARFDPPHRVLMRTLADQIGGAIHLARMKQRLEQSLDALARQTRDLQQTRTTLQKTAAKLDREARHARLGVRAEQRTLSAWLRRQLRVVAHGSAGLVLAVAHEADVPQESTDGSHALRVRLADARVALAWRTDGIEASAALIDRLRRHAAAGIARADPGINATPEMLVSAALASLASRNVEVIADTAIRRGRGRPRKLPSS